MRLLQRTRVLAAGFGLLVTHTVLFHSAPALAVDGSLLAQTGFGGLAVGTILGALVLFLLAKRSRLRAARQAELEQLAGVPADNPHPILRIEPSGEVRYANAAANVLLGRIGADPEIWEQWQEALRSMRGTGRTE